MKSARAVEPFWRRDKPSKHRDIVFLRPRALAKGDRFETVGDAVAESRRSQRELQTTTAGFEIGRILFECRDGYYQCGQTYCPRCARTFRRWFIGETLRIVNRFPGSSKIVTILLAASPDIRTLRPADHRHLIRKRLNRAGLKDACAIGGFEMIYRAREKAWVLHINLLVVRGSDSSIKILKAGFGSSLLHRPWQSVPLKDPAKQLSYLLKFSTYHRPFRQTGPTPSRAKPLNPREHLALVDWMSQHRFTDMMFLYGVRREGSRLRTRAKESSA